ncbi:hypothetical protein L1N97_14320 [Rheinheimera sp. UJ63]|nr:hypothetical protein [Rheinheimera sp. UJ63]
MGLFSWFGGLFDEGTAEFESVTDFATDDAVVNPANGNIMISGMGSVDIEGNAYGIDSIGGIGCDSTIDMFDGGVSDFSSSDSYSSGLDDSFGSFGSDDW